MEKPAASKNRRSSKQDISRGIGSAPSSRLASGLRWYEVLGLLLLSTLLLTLAFAPVSQFYLAWVGLAPFFLAVRGAKSLKGAFFWSWIGGTIFFIANMWWLAYVTVPGTIALLVYLGLYWGLAAWILRGCGLLSWAGGPGEGGAWVDHMEGVWAVFRLAVVWTALEWLRGNLFTGLPWLYLGYTQLPTWPSLAKVALPMCQVADALGIYGVTFWVALVNAVVGLGVMRWLSGRPVRPLWPAAAACGAVVLVVLGYGIFRIQQTPGQTYPGPQVMVVQSNYPQDNSGRKGATSEELVRYHLAVTRAALAKSPGTDLVVWSETMMPPINPQAQEYFTSQSNEGLRDYGRFLQETDQSLSNLAAEYHANLLMGGDYGDKWQLVKTSEGTYPLPADSRNAAYFYGANGRRSDEVYFKVHLVPFGEYMPFKQSFPPLYQAFQLFNPYPFDYTLQAGSQFTVFGLKDGARQQPARFVTPICFEDIVPNAVADMFRPETPGGPKRADFLVNITNDGWYRAAENAQHLQVAAFRSIENRVPTARSVNTGISGFVDSTGRIDWASLVPAGKEGVATGRLMLDRRASLYTRVGDLFAWMCLFVTSAIAVPCAVRGWKNRRLRKAE